MGLTKISGGSFFFLGFYNETSRTCLSTVGYSTMAAVKLIR